VNGLDELVRRAVDAPVGTPPDFEQVRARARRRHHRRVTGRVAAVVVAVSVVAGGVAVLRRDDAVPRIGTAGGARQTGPAPITHPLLESCTAATAMEGTLTGSGITYPAQVGEVFAVPSRGVAGPLATVVRGPVPAGGGDGTLPALIPNRTIAGRPANYGAGEAGQSGIDWLLPNGADATLRARDLTEADVLVLAEAISRGTGTLPAGLVSLGNTSGTTSWARTQCASTTGSFGAVVEAIQGTVVNRYAYVVSSPPGFRWDVGDITYVVVTTPGETPTSPPAIRQATPEEWNALIARTPQPTGTATTTRPR
jgi:hypothetical protein